MSGATTHVKIALWYLKRISVPERPLGARMQSETRSQCTLGCQVCWLVLCVHLTGVRGAQVAGKTLFPGVAGRVFQKEIVIQFRTLSKKDPHLSRGQAPPNPLEALVGQKR